MDSIPERLNQVLFLLSLSLWIGGIVIVAAAAPVVFQFSDSRDRASAIVGELLRKFILVKLIAAALIASTSLVDSLKWQHDYTPLLSMRYGLLLAMSALAAVSALITTPVLQALSRQVGSSDRSESGAARLRFDSIHRLNSITTTIEVGCGVAVFYTL